MATTTVTPNDQTPYLTLREATRLGYGSDTTLRRRIKQGTLPAVRIGSRLRVLRHDLDALAHPVQPAAHSCDEDLKWIQKLVEQAPPLTDKQRAELAVVLGGGR